MKKIIVLFVVALLAILLIFARNREKISVRLAGPTDGKISVVTTSFPVYDFARAIAGDRAQITLLLPPGVESHSFEPAPADIAAISAARVFFYTSDIMEPWAKKLADGLEKGKRPLLVDSSQGITMTASGEKYEEHDGDEDEHEAVEDPHIWTDPNNAMVMTKNILSALIAVDPTNESYYRENAKKQLAELSALDHDIKKVAATAKRREIVLGGRNAMSYFFKRYGITARAAFDSCSAGQEPSVRAVVELKELIEKNNVRVIYYEELHEPRVARALAEGTDAKLLLLHSLHNLSKADFDAGETYISLMRQNLENLKEGLI